MLNYYLTNNSSNKMADNFNEENSFSQAGDDQNQDNYLFKKVSDSDDDFGFQNQTSSEEEPFIFSGEGTSHDYGSDFQELDWSEYEDYIDQKFIPTGGEEALKKQRAQAQSGWEQAGISLAKLVPNVALSIAENAGYLLDVEAHINTLTGKGSDYSNWLTEFAKEGKEAVTDTFGEVYRENPNEVFDLGDPAWWYQHGSGLLESITAFAATGMGAGAVFSGGAKGMARLIARAAKSGGKGMQGLRAAAKAGKVLQGGAQIGTAASLAYTEGAMTAADTYKSEYEKNLAFFKERGEVNAEELARKNAAEAAANVVKFNTVINTMTNLTSAGMFTRGFNANRNLARSFGKRVGESRSEWIKRLKSDPVASRNLSKVLGSTGGEMLQESTEEIVNELSVAFGEEKGRELRGEEREGYLSALAKQFSREETALAAILGAVGGAGQKTIMSMTPQAKKDRKAEDDRRQSQVNYLIERLESYESAQKSAREAMEKGEDGRADYQKAQAELFSLDLTNAFISGTQDQLSQMFNEIENLTEEEAKNQGYDTHEGPQNYKRLARRAQNKIKDAAKDYDAIINAYNAYDSEAAKAFYGENIFHNRYQIKALEDNIKDNFEVLDKLKADLAESQRARSTKLDADTVAKNTRAQEIRAEIQGVEQLIKKQEEVLKNLPKQINKKAPKKQLKKKYGNKSPKETWIQHIKNKELEKLKRFQAQLSPLQSEYDDIVDGMTQEEINAQISDALDQASISNFYSAILDQQETLKELNENYSKLLTEEGKEEFIKDFKEEEENKEKEKNKEKKNEQAETEEGKDQQKRNAVKTKIKAEKEGSGKVEKEETGKTGDGPVGEQADDTSDTSSKDSKSEVSEEGTTTTKTKKKDTPSGETGSQKKTVEKLKALQEIGKEAKTKTKDGESIYELDNDEFERQSNYVAQKTKGKEQIEKEKKDVEANKRKMAGAAVGNFIDIVARDVFAGKLKSFKQYQKEAAKMNKETGFNLDVTEDEYNKLVKDLTAVKDSMPQMEFLSLDLFVHAFFNDKARAKFGRDGLAGALDLVAVDPEGRIHIIDFKNKKYAPEKKGYWDESLYVDDQYESKKTEWSRQQTVYAELLRMKGFDVASTNILLYPTTYEIMDDTVVVSKIRTPKGILKRIPDEHQSALSDRIIKLDTDKKILAEVEKDTKGGKPQVKKEPIEKKSEEATEVTEEQVEQEEKNSTNKTVENVLKTEDKEIEQYEDGETSNTGEKVSSENQVKTKDGRGATKGKVIVEASSTMAYISKEPGKSGKTENNDQSPDFNKAIESVNDFNPGDEITIELDLNYTYLDKKTGEMVKASDFINEDGSIDIDEVPLVIKRNGLVSGFVRTQSWINATNKFGYKNVSNEDGNVEAQSKLNRKLRETVVNQGKVTTTITKKDRGHLSKNMIDGKNVSDTLENSLPLADSFVIIKKGAPFTSPKGRLSDKSYSNDPAQFADQNGTILVKLPAPNGEFILAPIQVPTLSKSQVSTFMKILEANTKFGNNEQLASEILEKAQFDVNSNTDLLELLNNIAHVTDEKMSEFKKKVNDPKASGDRININYSTKTGVFSIARQRGNIIDIATAQDLLDNADVIKDMLSDRLFSVKLAKLNIKTAKALELDINDDNEVSTKYHKTYNDYIKTHLKTNLKSNKLSDKEESYFDHPNIHFDIESIIGKETPKINLNDAEEIADEYTLEETSEETTDDIEAKKADIESRRKELKTKYNLEIVNKGNGFHIVRNGKTISIFNTKKEAEQILDQRINDLISNMISSPIDLGGNISIAGITVDGATYSVLNVAERMVTIVNIGGVNVPFYLTTGHGGKNLTPAWYPMFGYSESGWLNKTNGKDMESYYERLMGKEASDILKKTAEKLNAKFGTTPNSIKQTGILTSKQTYNAVNSTLNFKPVENQKIDPSVNAKEELKKLEDNIASIGEQINAKYDAELAALGGETTDTTSADSAQVENGTQGDLSKDGYVAFNNNDSHSQDSVRIENGWAMVADGVSSNKNSKAYADALLAELSKDPVLDPDVIKGIIEDVSKRFKDAAATLALTKRNPDGSFSYFTLGDSQVIVVDKNGNTKQTFAQVDKKGNIDYGNATHAAVAGYGVNGKFQTGKINLEDGEKIIIASDGIVDVFQYRDSKDADIVKFYEGMSSVFTREQLEGMEETSFKELRNALALLKGTKEEQSKAAIALLLSLEKNAMLYDVMSKNPELIHELSLLAKGDDNSFVVLDSKFGESAFQPGGKDVKSEEVEDTIPPFDPDEDIDPNSINEEDFNNDINDLFGSIEEGDPTGKDNSAQDVDLSPEMRESLTDGLEEFLVYDKRTNTYFNEMKQEEAIDGILNLIVRGYQAGLSTKDAFNSAKAEFVKYRNRYNMMSKAFDKVNEANKKLLGLKSAEDAEETMYEMDKILRNWGQFQKFTQDRITMIFGTGFMSTMDDQAVSKKLDEIQEAAAMLEKQSFEDGASFSISSKDTASAKLKMFLSVQEKPTRNYLGLKSFLPMDTVWRDLSSILAGTVPSFEVMKERLLIYGHNKPYIKNMIKQIEADPQRRKEFVTTFAKQVANFISMDYSSGKRKNGTFYYNTRVFNSNRNELTNVILQKWVEDQKTSDIVKTVKGEKIIDKAKAAEFKTKMDEFGKTFKASVKDEDLEELSEVLKSVGIGMPVEALKLLAEESTSIGEKMEFHKLFTDGTFSYIADAFVREDDKEAEIKLELNNPLQGVHAERSSIKTLAQLASQFQEYAHATSHRNIEGKTIQTYVLKSNMSHIMDDLTSGDSQRIKEVLETYFGENSIYANRLNDPELYQDFINEFRLEYTDGFNKQNTQQKGLKRNNQSEREMEFHELMLFQNKGNRAAKILFPTISDKGIAPLLNVLKENVKVYINPDTQEWSIIRESAEIINNIVEAEINRINNYVAPENSEDNIHGIDTGGSKQFFFFNSLNAILKEDGFTKEGNIKVDTIPKLLKAAHEEFRATVDNTLSNWSKLGIISEEGNMFDSTYDNEITNKLGKFTNEVSGTDQYYDDMNYAKAVYAAVDIELHYMLAHANLHQMLIGDPAAHYKGSVENTFVQIQKRLAKDLAPGLEGEFENREYRVVFSKDKKTDSKHIEEYVKLLGEEKASNYKGMTGTDAQELTTAQEHLTVMYAYGRLSKTDYDKLMDKANKEEDFTEAELSTILQPMKPVQVSMRHIKERGILSPVYIKSSSIPLIPQLTKGLEIDGIRTQMLEHEIDRFSYVSGSKLGFTNLVDTWDGEYLKEGFSLKDKAVVLNRSGFRIQQEVPYKEGKDEITLVTQMNKLLFSGLTQIEEYVEEFIQKQEDKVEIKKKMYALSIRRFVNDFGMVEAELTSDQEEEVQNLTEDELVAYKAKNGVYQFKDLRKLRSMLLKEVTTSPGYSKNDVKLLELTEDGKQFKFPMALNGSSKKFESLLFSVISNKILKQKMPGKSYVQASSAGFLTGAKKGKGWSDLSEKDRANIIWTNDADPDKGLQFVREEDGKVRGAQLLVPFYFMKGKKRLKVEDYLIEKDGKKVLDPNKVPEELLRLIGARIPNQGHSSMLPVEIAGFIPESLGDLIIVPDEITAQMGSDFDVDKLYVYHYNYSVAEDGTLSKTEPKEDDLKTLQNDYMQLHWDILTNPEVIKKVLSPLDASGEYSLASEAEIISKARVGQVQLPLISRKRQSLGYVENRTGKTGVGVYSLSSTFNAILEHVKEDVYLGKYGKKGKIVKNYIQAFTGYKLGMISGPGSKNRPKALLHQDMQNAAVDNANDQLLAKVNISEFTQNASIALAQLSTEGGKNLNIKHLTRFLSQPIIYDYVERVANAADKFGGLSKRRAKEKAFEDMRSELIKQGAELNSSLSFNEKQLLDMISTPMDKRDTAWKTKQLFILNTFEELDSIGEIIMNASKAINSDSKGVPPSMYEATAKIDKITNINGNPSVRGLMQLVDVSSESGYATAVGPYFAHSIFSGIIQKETPAIKQIFAELAYHAGKDEFTADEKERIFEGLMNYKFVSHNVFSENAELDRQRLLYSKEGSPSLAERVQEAQDTWGKDSFLLQRLSPKFGVKANNPHRVEYAAAGAETTDQTAMIRSFISLLTSKDSKKVALAKDLITYSYITSAKQGANNFIKNIPAAYLMSDEILSEINKISFDNIGKNFIRDFIQHNPDFAPSIDSLEVDAFKTEDGEYNVLDDSTDPKLTERQLAMIESRLAVGDPEAETDAQWLRVGYMQGWQNFKLGEDDDMYDIVNIDGQLYQLDEERSVYTPIDNKGKDGLLEYGTSADSIYNYDNFKAKQKEKIKNKNEYNPITDPKSPINDNKFSGTFTLDELGLELDKPVGKQELLDLVADIAKDSTNPEHKALANFILKASDAISEELSFVSTTKHPMAGIYWGDGTLTLNPKMLASKETGKLNVPMYERTLLHEIVHAMTVHAIAESPDSTLKSINAVMEMHVKNYSPEQRAEFDSFIEQYEIWSAIEEKSDPFLTWVKKQGFTFTKAKIREYYALMNQKEFVVFVLQSKRFQNELNEQQFGSTKKTLLDRIKDILSKMYKALAKGFGVQVKEGSALEAVLEDIANMVDYQTTFKPNLSKDSNSNNAFASIEESGLTPSYNKILNNLKTKRTQLKGAISQKGADRESIQLRLDKLDKQIDQFETDANLEAIKKISGVQLDWVEETLSKPEISDAELRQVDQTIAIWENLRDVFKEDFAKETEKELTPTLTRAANLRHREKTIFVDTLINSSKKSAIGVPLSKKDFTPTADLSWIKSQALTINDSSHPLLHQLGTLIYDAQIRTNLELGDFIEKKREAFEGLSKEDFRLIMQMKDGVWTGRLVDEYSQNWYDTLRELRHKAKENGNWNSLNEFKKHNSISVQPDILFEEDGSMKKTEGAKKHLDTLEKELGKEKADRVLKEAKEKYNEYLEAKQMVEEELETRLMLAEEENKTKVARQNAQTMSEWKMKNSPYFYMKALKGQFKDPKIKPEGYKYVVTVPKKNISGKSSPWYDKSYETVQNDPKLKQAYTFYKETMDDIIKYLPTYMAKDMKNFIPQVRKGLMEMYKSEGMAGLKSKLSSDFLYALTSDEETSVSADRDIRTGKINKKIPIRFTKKLEAEERSEDIGLALEMFMKSALHYKHMSRIENKAQFIQRAVNSLEEKVLGSRSQGLTDSKGDPYIIKDGLINMKKMVEHHINAQIYNDRKNRGAEIGVVLADNLKDSPKANKLLKELNELDRQLSAGNITKIEHHRRQTEIKEELEKLNTRPVTTDRLTDSFIWANQILRLGYNILSAQNNVTFGIVQNFIHAAGKEDYTPKQLRQAYRMMLSSTARSLGVESEAADKIYNLITKLDVLFEVDETALSGKERSERMKKTPLGLLAPHELQRRGEYFAQGMVTVAMMLNTEVITKDGTKTNLFEAFDSNGDWNTELMGENKNWGGDPNKPGELTNFVKFSRKVIEVNKRIHGNYDPKQLPQYKRTEMGRALGQFRSWLPAAIESRWGKSNKNPALGRETKGYYRTIMELGALKTIKTYGKLLMRNERALDGLSEVDAANVRKAMAGLSFTLTTIASAIFIAGIFDDDDEETKFARNLLLNQIGRVQDDLMFYVTPDSFKRITQSPFPIMKIYTDFLNTTGAAFDFMFQDEEDKRRQMDGEELARKMMKHTPWTQGIDSFLNAGEKLYNK